MAEYEITALARKQRSIHDKCKHATVDQCKEIGETKEVVYHIPCKGCKKAYVGNTGRTYKTRQKEHEYAIKCHNQNNSLSIHRDQDLTTAKQDLTTAKQECCTEKKTRNQDIIWKQLKF